MKNTLLATTALVVTAGAAAADVAVTGFAEIGVLGGDAYATEQFHTDIDVTFTMTGEADNGLTFGAVVDLDENGAFGNTTQGGETYFVAFGNARLDMGDTDGAYDAALADIAGPAGSIADDHTTHAGFSGTTGLDGNYDGQIARFSYTFDAFTGHLSVEIDDAGDYEPVWGLGFAYNADLGGLTLGVGLGYQSGDDDNTSDTIAGVNTAIGALVISPEWAALTNDDDRLAAVLASVAAAGEHERQDIWGISLSTTFSNGIQGTLVYEEANYGDDVTLVGSSAEKETYWGLGLGYTMNALSLGVNYGETDSLLGVEGLSSNGWGLAANYDLGGGLVAQFGYGKSNVDLNIGGFDGSVETDQYSLGLAMSF